MSSGPWNWTLPDTHSALNRTLSRYANFVDVYETSGARSNCQARDFQVKSHRAIIILIPANIRFITKSDK